MWAYLPCGIWDLSSPTRDQTHVPWIRTWILDHWTIREVPSIHLLADIWVFLLLLLLQSCPTLCDPIDRSPPDSPIPGILQARTGVGCHFLLQCMKVKSEREVTQSCPTLHDLMDCSPPGSSVHGIFQARELEWGTIDSPWVFLHLGYCEQCCNKHRNANIPLRSGFQLFGIIPKWEGWIIWLFYF